MPIIAKVDPDNRIPIKRFGPRVQGHISVRGTGNVLRIAESAKTPNFRMNITGNGNRVIIGKDCRLNVVAIYMEGDDQTITIGDETTFEDVAIICNEGCNVSIGTDCMFSRDVWIRSTDAHSVLDRQTGERLNRAASVSIGDHVWIGQGVTVGKGVSIAPDCVIGFGSFVSRSIEESGVIAAGTPALVKRTGITWDRRRLAQLEPEHHWRNRPSSAAADSAE